MLDAVPMWLVYFGTVAVFVLASMAGHGVGSWLKRSREDASDETNLGALLALLGLMIAFTFGIAASRFEERKVLLVEEATAIGTAYLRAGLLPEPARTEVRDLFRAYVDLRLGLRTVDHVQAAVAGEEKFQEEIWSRVERYVVQNPTPPAASLMQSVNHVIDAQAKRLALGIRNRMPPVIVYSLYGLVLLALFVMGMKRRGDGSAAHFLTVLGLVVTLGVIVAMIVDLDRPGEGLMRVSQQAMRDVRTGMTR